MSNILDKITFRFLIGQLLPGMLLVLTFNLELQFIRGGCLGNYADLLDQYVKVLQDSSSVSAIVLLLIEAAVIGLVLQGITTLAAANLESFLKNEWNDKQEWVPKSDDRIRHRSPLRKLIALLFTNSRTGVIFLLAPFILIFDLVTILAAPARLYKEIYLLRAGSRGADLLKYALSDYQYMSEYFINMAVAILVWTGWLISIFNTFDYFTTPVILIVLAYIAIGLHFMLYRTIRDTIISATTQPSGSGS